MSVSVRPPNVVLIGGTGFIGQHLAARLSDDGVGVLVPVRHYESAKQLTMLPGVDVEVANIHDDAVLRKLLAGRDAVINLVGVLHGGHGRPYGEGFRHLHVELPRRIAAACADVGVPRYLHMSALGADSSNPSSSPSMYGRSKSDGELAARSQPTVAATVFRPSVVFGPGDHFLTMFARLQRHLPLVPLAASRARFQPVYVGDVAAAFSIALARPDLRDATIELGGPAVYTLGQLVRLAGRFAGRERPVLGLPDWAARLQARLFELLPGDPLVSRDNLDSMLVDNVVAADTHALTAESLGIKLTAIESAAPHYLNRHDRLDAYRTHAGR
ncbi:complex I NDUFA9 subunit family protein [Massilia timonae]|uniref:3-beta hydroxysteroid dehydrogenase/isomerase family protein n=1 Tax=Massilia timonae TaxID=47229 RepID=A0A1S2N344_9BURK|nr:complex I NDUFA9 subunit family protein [Massilia timonae]OIJ39505.1 3-beta hydroxysteroid dehydrogenase/isomerase family protein [Massilia timonae]